ncbi:SRPBCC family protein [Chloroflexota bacterium]
MATVDKVATIKALVEEIFRYISTPSNLVEVWPSLVEINDVRSLPNGGYSAQWVYEMVGMRFEGTAEYTDIAPNHWFIIETQGDIKSRITWTFRSVNNIDDITKVTLTIEYEAPFQLLRKLSEAIIMEFTNHEGELMIDNLKNRFAVTS